ncbi:ankyrin [Serendipita vermifera]|nr:ankyrin [Serendipita vermifera]
MGDKDFKPSQLFHDAASFVSTSPQLKNISNNIKLELYALYKIITVSRTPNTGRPSIFDMTGRAKWDAWAKYSKEVSEMTIESVETRYLELCKGLGWVESGGGETSKGSSTQVASTSAAGNEEEEDVHKIDWDAPYDPSSDPHRNGGKAMGNAVSVLQQAEEDNFADQSRIHGIVLLGDLAKLETALSLDPKVDLNEKDEFGYTPLHLAADRGFTSIVETLLKHGADRTILDADGFSATELAEASGKDDIVKLLRA